LIKKAIFPRILVFFAGYIIIFCALVTLQFAKYGSFTKRLGDLTVSGRYLTNNTAQVPLGFDWRPITGNAAVSFNGIEYRLAEENKLTLVYADGGRRAESPEYIAFADEEKKVGFRFRDGSKLSFTVEKNSNGEELSIIMEADEGLESIELPYKLLASSRIQQVRGGLFAVVFNDVKYVFSPSLVNLDKQAVVLSKSEPIAAYLPIIDPPPSNPVEKPPELEDFAFNPADFVIPDALNKTVYNTAVEQWRGRVFLQWAGVIGSAADEVLVAAYESEAIRRGTYQQAVSAVPPAFINWSEGKFAASVYFGRLDQALRSLTVFERATEARLTQQINGRSLDFFKESRPVGYICVRGLNALADSLAVWMRTLDPSAITPDLVPAILDAYADWAFYRPALENPFTKFMDRAYSLISAGIRKNAKGDKVFVFNNGSADMLFNLRLGISLATYAESAGNNDWAAAARSVALSVLSMTNTAGQTPKELLVSDILADRPASSESAVMFNSAYLYRELASSEYYPHVAGVNAANRQIWAWTASNQITPAIGNNYLDIAISFPVNQTHYMLIRNVPNFIRLQLHNIDYRTDANFERYDSSGWVYSQSEQTLLVKMKHRSPIEHIRIFW
jgi:hypothetical protein